ncbi:MAG: hypothetical protein VW239_01535 [Candidatus Nanopelagicales bacterium]
MNEFMSYARVAQEVRVARDIQRQQPDIPWAEALRIASKWIAADPLTDAPKGK